MGDPLSDISALAWLVATQFMLYALGWGLCSLLLREQRAAIAHWGGFMLLVGAGFVMSALRSEPRTWGAYVGSNLLFMVGYTLLCRGLERFMGVAPRDREHGLTLLTLATLFVLAGPEAGNAPWRVLLAYGGGMLMLARTVATVRQPMADEFGRGLSWALSFPALLLIGMFGLRVTQQLLDFDRVFEMHLQTAANRNMLIGYLAGAAMFNFSFMGLMTTRLVRRLREQSRQDPLTGLLNRRALEREFEREWHRLQRGGAGFAVLALDLDHFKRINDDHGHLVGDSALAQTAQRLLGASRKTDAVARTGGEEFIVLVPQIGIDGAMAAAERLRTSVSGAPFDLAGQAVPLSVSVGVAMACSADLELMHVLQRADKALYRAKQGGRDRVVLGEP